MEVVLLYQQTPLRLEVEEVVRLYRYFEVAPIKMSLLLEEEEEQVRIAAALRRLLEEEETEVVAML